MNDPVKDFVYDILQLPEWAAFDARTKEVKALRDAIWHHWKDKPTITIHTVKQPSVDEAFSAGRNVGFEDGVRHGGGHGGVLA